MCSGPHQGAESGPGDGWVSAKVEDEGTGRADADKGSRSEWSLLYLRAEMSQRAS